jgi:prevent-host-death family protein
MGFSFRGGALNVYHHYVRLGLREANQRFSRAIKAVRAGKEVVLTERGRPIAVITPIKAETAQAAAHRGLVDGGLIAPAAREGPMPAPRWRPLKVKGKAVSQTIIDDPEDRA